MESEPQADQVDGWALVEIFGHDKIAGRISTRKFGTEVMFQVDVPGEGTAFEFTRLLNPKSIFAIQPTSEDWCRRFAQFARSQAKPILPYVPTAKQLGQGEDPGAVGDDLLEDDEDDLRH